MTGVGFDFSHAMHRLCHDIVRNVAELSHIDMDQVAVAFAQTRRRVSYGLQAKLTPMRFENGSRDTVRHGRRWTVERLFQDDREILYILTFYLPRFLNHSVQEKLVTVVHELYHISPAFDGDIRRHDGRYHVHSHSQQQYDENCAKFVETYLSLGPSPDVLGFLKFNFRALKRQYGGVSGLRVPIPKLVPLEKSA